jgi:FixJ family two-component response regulator
MVNRSLVSVVDDDESVRESLPDLLRELGYAVQAFSSAEEFLASDYVGQTSCLVLDTSRQSDAKDGSPLSRRPGDNGRETPPCICAERLTLHRL